MNKIYNYYIYHIEGIKIGLTTNIEHRMEEQGFTNYEILIEEQGDYDYGWIMGDKELELQKEYGYNVDKTHYMVSRNNRHKWGNSEDQSKYSKQVKNRYIFNNTSEENSKYAKIAWDKHRDKMLVAAKDNIKLATNAAAKSPNRASLQLYYCEDCCKDIKGAGAAARHGKSQGHKTYKKI